MLVLSILVAALWGCGGSSSSNNNTSSNTTPPANSGSSSGSSGTGSSGSTGPNSQPGGSGGTGTGSSGSNSQPGAATEFQAILIRAGDNQAVQDGMITIDATQADGKGEVQVSGGDPNFNYQLRFCSFRTGDCIISGNVNTDASGNATTSFQFPQKGIWSGTFNVAAPGDTKSFYSTFPAPPDTGQYVSPLQRASTVVDISKMNLGTPGSDPLQSGQLTVTPNQSGGAGAQTSLKFTLNGAAPNQNYLAGFCSGPASTCYAVTGQVSTDASGNASATLSFSNFNPDGVFYLTRDGDPSGTLEFIVGFQEQ